MVEHNNAIPNAVPVEEAMLLLATALEGRLEESDRPRLEQALLEHPSLRAAAADMALAPAEHSDDQESPLPIGLTRAAREAHATGCFGGHHGQRRTSGLVAGRPHHQQQWHRHP